MSNELDIFALNPQAFLDSLNQHTAAGTKSPDSATSGTSSEVQLAKANIDPDIQQFIATVQGQGPVQPAVPTLSTKEVGNVNTNTIGPMLQQQTINLSNSNNALLQSQAQALTDTVQKITLVQNAEIDLSAEKQRIAKHIESLGLSKQAEAELVRAGQLKDKVREVQRRRGTLLGSLNPLNEIREGALLDELNTTYTHASQLLNDEAALINRGATELAASEATKRLSDSMSLLKSSTDAVGMIAKQADQQMESNLKVETQQQANLLNSMQAKDNAANRAESSANRRYAQTQAKEADQLALMSWVSFNEGQGKDPKTQADIVKSYSPEKRQAVLARIKYSTVISPQAAEFKAVQEARTGSQGVADWLSSATNQTIRNFLPPEITKQWDNIMAARQPKAMALAAAQNKVPAEQGADIAFWNKLTIAQQATYYSLAEQESAKLNLADKGLYEQNARLSKQLEIDIKKMQAETDPNKQRVLAAAVQFNSMAVKAVGTVLNDMNVNSGEAGDQRKLVKGIDEWLKKNGFAESSNAKLRNEMTAKILTNLAKARYFAELPKGTSRVLGMPQVMPIYIKDGKAIDLSRPENVRLVVGSSFLSDWNDTFSTQSPTKGVGGPVQNMISPTQNTAPADSLHGPIADMLNSQANLFGFGKNDRPPAGTPTSGGSPIIRG